MLKIGNIGARLDDMPGLWAIVELLPGDRLLIRNIESGAVDSVPLTDYWPLLDSMPN